MKEILKKIYKVISAATRSLRLIAEVLVLLAIVSCIIIAVLMALIAEGGGRLSSNISSALTALVKSLGDHLLKEQ